MMSSKDTYRINKNKKIENNKKEHPEIDALLMGKARIIKNNDTVERYENGEISEEEAAEMIFNAFNRKPDERENY